jgi:pantoate--beta-alanine ligase
VTATLIRRRDEWVEALDGARSAGGTVGLVPTMGALHGGHLSLIRRAAADCSTVAVTIYVNPLQFGAGEDLASYPRRLDDDLAAATGAGAGLVFAPSVEEMWPSAPRTSVRVDDLTSRWEGAARPGHFDGVATIVAKLFGLAGRCTAYFGEKDYQQLAVIRRLAADLSLPVAVAGCPTVRDADGLALSSRNAYLTANEREAAPKLYWSLLAGKRAVEEERTRDPEDVVAAVRAALAAEPRFEIDYAAVVDPGTLRVPPHVDGEVRLLVAARLGRARLIDNLAAVSPHPSPEEP